MKPGTYHLIRQLERGYQHPVLRHDSFGLAWPGHVWEPVRINVLGFVHYIHPSLPLWSPPHPSAENAIFS